jgi:undecaprenyl-diphosphatase
MSALSAVGGTTGIAALALLMAAYFSFRGAPWAAILTVASPVGAGMVETALKLTFHRARPHLWAVHGSPATYSFPSGHAAISLAFFAAVTLLAWRFGGSRLGVVMAALCVPLVLGIGLSRVYLGVHWPTDVLGGYAVGLAWVCTLSLILDRIMGHHAAHAADS